MSFVIIVTAVAVQEEIIYLLAAVLDSSKLLSVQGSAKFYN